jgi:hypothetical protein
MMEGNLPLLNGPIVFTSVRNRNGQMAIEMSVTDISVNNAHRTVTITFEGDLDEIGVTEVVGVPGFEMMRGEKLLLVYDDNPIGNSPVGMASVWADQNRSYNFGSTDGQVDNRIIREVAAPVPTDDWSPIPLAADPTTDPTTFTPPPDDWLDEMLRANPINPDGSF